MHRQHKAAGALEPDSEYATMAQITSYGLEMGSLDNEGTNKIRIHI